MLALPARLRVCGPRTKVTSVFLAFVGVWGKRAREHRPKAVGCAVSGGQGSPRTGFLGPGSTDATRTVARGRAAELCAARRLSSLSVPSQGDRGFDGLAGLPGEKGHRVSVLSERSRQRP